MSQLGVMESYAAAKRDAVAFLGACDVVCAISPDARRYLESQCSQDLSGMVAGSAVESLLLSPQGKIEAYVDVAALSEEQWAVIGDVGSGELIKARLSRFKLRVRAELTTTAWQRALVFGPAGDRLKISGAVAHRELHWFAVGGDAYDGATLGIEDAASEGDVAALEVLRIEAGIPEMGSELNEKTIPQEAGIVGRAVSFTKGCYPGQELVARIDARGNRVPRRLRGVIVAAGANGPAPVRGDVLEIDGAAVGELTSVAPLPGQPSYVALAYCRREVTPPTEAMLRNANGEFAARIVELPSGN